MSGRTHGMRRDVLMCACGHKVSRSVTVRNRGGFYEAVEVGNKEKRLPGVCPRCGARYPHWRMVATRMEDVGGLAVWNEEKA